MCKVVGDGRLLPAAVHRELERSDRGREHQASTGETAVCALGGEHQTLCLPLSMYAAPQRQKVVAAYLKSAQEASYFWFYTAVWFSEVS